MRNAFESPRRRVLSRSGASAGTSTNRSAAIARPAARMNRGIGRHPARIRRRAGRKVEQGLRHQQQQREGPVAENKRPSDGVKPERKEQRLAGRALIREAPGLGAVRVAQVTAPMSLEATRVALRCLNEGAVRARVLFPVMEAGAQRAPTVRAAAAVWEEALEEAEGVKPPLA